MKSFMGVSIRNPFYSKKENILKAISLAKDFDEFLIFVVDFPYRLSLQAFENMSEKEAEKTALKEGKELKEFLINISKQFKNVKIVSWKEIESDNYKNLLLEIKDLEKRDEEFSKLIEGEFTGTIISKIEDNKNKKQLSINFIMEEIAMFVSLVMKGYDTRISKYSRSKSIDYFLKKKNLFIEHIRLSLFLGS